MSYKLDSIGKIRASLSNRIRQVLSFSILHNIRICFQMILSFRIESSIRRRRQMNTSEVSHMITFLFLPRSLSLPRLIICNQWCNRLQGFFFYYYICTSSNFFTCLPQVSFSLFLHWFKSIYIYTSSTILFFLSLSLLLLQLCFTRILYHVLFHQHHSSRSVQGYFFLVYTGRYVYLNSRFHQGASERAREWKKNCTCMIEIRILNEWSNEKRWIQCFEKRTGSSILFNATTNSSNRCSRFLYA